MKPLCADCGTEHQPCDHPADQWPENRRAHAQELIERLQRRIDVRQELGQLRNSLYDVLRRGADIPRTPDQEAAIRKALQVARVLHEDAANRALNTETELLNLIEKGPSHE